MNVVRALQRVDRFQIQQMANDVKLIGDPISAMHVAGGAGDVQSLARTVALQ